jgi:hypothetical protein
MKRIVLFALLFAAVAASAHSQAMAPKESPRYYRCDYTNPTMGEVDNGVSRFSFIYQNLPDLKRGIEYFDATWGQDNRKVTFAKPADRYRFNIHTGEYELWATDWEFTINPSGPQCTRARVTNWGDRISFSNCSDGHSRVCLLQ